MTDQSTQHWFVHQIFEHRVVCEEFERVSQQVMAKILQSIDHDKTLTLCCCVIIFYVGQFMTCKVYTG